MTKPKALTRRNRLITTLYTLELAGLESEDQLPFQDNFEMNISADGRRFVALKVFSGKSSSGMRELLASLQPLTPEGKKHVEAPMDAFTIRRLEEDHFCAVLEPLGTSLSEIIDEAFDRRYALNEPKGYKQRVLEGDPWSINFAKRACWQILAALDHLHSCGIAHRDIRSSNVCFALDHDLSALGENEIQKLWELDFEEYKIRSVEQWLACDPGDAAAEPHSEEWNKANFFNSRHDIELLQRRDGKPFGPGEIRYTIAPTPLDNGYDLNKVVDPDQAQTFTLLTDLGLASRFEDCATRPMPLSSDYMAPEGLLDLPCTHKADVFSLGLLFWEIVMLRPLVERQFQAHDPGYAELKNRQLHDLAVRLGPIPSALRARWRDADRFVDAEGNALKLPKEADDDDDDEEEDEGEEDFSKRDIWHYARKSKPLDMSDGYMELFVRLLLRMLQWEPEMRPSAAELMQEE
ncbi:hypothetical protein M426DRAFT_267346 [Hypoxylon sp. CI-4A]|nr:hypothetical protein M426DRAFT_267346 [Hypoxylon sp. CI-4A]